MKILYLGGFELPDKNAAAHRVIGIAKTLRLVGHDVTFIGISKQKDCSENIEDSRTESFGFTSYSIPYPSGLFQWMRYITTNPFVNLLEKLKPDVIIAYNYPAIALHRLLKICRKNNILILGDVTEWYSPTGNPIHRIVKWLDTEYRMKFVHKKLDGLIVISKYLAKYYKSQNTVIIPPTIDLEDAKWNQNRELSSNENLIFVYAGSPGGKAPKDMLNKVIDLISRINITKELKIIGITQEQYLETGNSQPPEFVNFLGRLSHTSTLSEVQKADFQIFIRPINRVTTAGFPTKFVESLACGTPVITNRSSNIDQYLIEGQNGYWADDTYNKKLIETLENLNRTTKLKLKHNCRDNQQFDYRSYSSQISQFLNRVLR